MESILSRHPIRYPDNPSNTDYPSSNPADDELDDDEYTEYTPPRYLGESVSAYGERLQRMGQTNKNGKQGKSDETDRPPTARLNPTKIPVLALSNRLPVPGPSPENPTLPRPHPPIPYPIGTNLQSLQPESHPWDESRRPSSSSSARKGFWEQTPETPIELSGPPNTPIAPTPSNVPAGGARVCLHLPNERNPLPGHSGSAGNSGSAATQPTPPPPDHDLSETRPLTSSPSSPDLGGHPHRFSGPEGPNDPDKISEVNSDRGRDDGSPGGGGSDDPSLRPSDILSNTRGKQPEVIRGDLDARLRAYRRMEINSMEAEQEADAWRTAHLSYGTVFNQRSLQFAYNRDRLISSWIQGDQKEKKHKDYKSRVRDAVDDLLRERKWLRDQLTLEMDRRNHQIRALTEAGMLQNFHRIVQSTPVEHGEPENSDIPSHGEPTGGQGSLRSGEPGPSGIPRLEPPESPSPGPAQPPRSLPLPPGSPNPESSGNPRLGLAVPGNPAPSGSAHPLPPPPPEIPRPRPSGLPTPAPAGVPRPPPPSPPGLPRLGPAEPSNPEPAESPYPPPEIPRPPTPGPRNLVPANSPHPPPPVPPIPTPAGSPHPPPPVPPIPTPAGSPCSPPLASPGPPTPRTGAPSPDGDSDSPNDPEEQQGSRRWFQKFRLSRRRATVH